MCAASVLCGEESINDEQSAKIKRDASVGSFSYTATDISKYDGSHVKTLMILKNVDKNGAAEAYSSYQATQKMPKVKTTVEFWPPDMDKEKFYNMKKDSEMSMWSQVVKHEAPIKINQKPMPEKIEDNKAEVKSHSWPPNDFNDYQSLIGPTEGIINDDVAITNPGPVVFPTLEPTTKGPGRHVVYITRSGHKKRKLKKKAKAESEQLAAFVETSSSNAPDTNSVSDISSSNENISDATPIYEFIDEPYVDIFKPVRYTDVVSNLANLTESTFGDRVNISSENVKIIKNAKPINSSSNVYTETADLNVSDSVPVNGSNQSMEMTSGGSNATNDMPISSPSIPLNINDLTPLEKLFSQLKLAIDERDITKIKKIVQLLEEPVKEVIITPSSSVAAPTESFSPISSTLASVEASTNGINKIYLAPRIRVAQKKLKQLITNTTDEQLKENNVTAAETLALSSSSTMLVSTTEKMTSKVPSSRKNRRGRANVTPRVKKVLKRSRQTVVSRRTGRKTS